MAIVVGAATLGERPDRAVAAGRARQIIRGVYTIDMSTPLERLVRDHVWQIVAHLIPDALICDRSAGPLLFDGDSLFVISEGRHRDLHLPGLRVAVRRGYRPLFDDPLWLAGIRKSSIPRALVENLAPTRARKGVSRTLSKEELAAWVAQLAQQYPAERLNRFRDRAREISDLLGFVGRFPLLDDMFGAALGTRGTSTDDVLAVAARRWDLRRVEQFDRLVEQLNRSALAEVPSSLGVRIPAQLREQPFFESYLSNFIEGTEFTIDEAVAIVYSDEIPASRPADAHDVTSTYELITDRADARDVPADADAFVDQLVRRHALLMAARPEVRPGRFKQVPNRVGSYDFVQPQLVESTLRRGYTLRDGLTSAFARALYIAFLISEIHPFDDGNGRLARLAMNTEFSAAGQHRILIPLIVRNDYLAGLRRLSRDGDPRLLVRVLANAWQWSSQVDFSAVSAARLWLDGQVPSIARRARQLRTERSVPARRPDMTDCA